MDAPRSSFTNPRRPSPARVGFRVAGLELRTRPQGTMTARLRHTEGASKYGDYGSNTRRAAAQRGCRAGAMQANITGQLHTHGPGSPLPNCMVAKKQLSNSQQNKRLYMTEITQDPASIPPTLCHFPPSQLFVCTPFPTEPASPSDSLVRISCCVSGLDSSSASYPPRSVVAT